jgi:hypothetical protein
MIEVRRAADSPVADSVESRLRDLVVAHRVVVVDAGAGSDLPLIRDGKVTVSGAEIPAFLDQLTRDVAEWSRFQSDACYLEDDGSIC